MRQSLCGFATGWPSRSARSSRRRTRVSERWVGTWATALVGRPQTPPPPGPPAPAPFMRNACPAPPPPATPPAAAAAPARRSRPRRSCTSRIRRCGRSCARASAGRDVRVVLSNTFGTAPLTIGAAHIALRDSDDAIRAGPGAPLTFSGRAASPFRRTRIVYSDPVALTVPPLADLAIDVYLPAPPIRRRRSTMHTAAFQTTYISETGNHAGAAKLPTVATMRSWFLLSRVEVDAPDAVGRRRRLRRFDHRWRRVDSRHEQPLAGRPREAAARVRRRP